MRGFLTFLFGACLTGALAAQQPTPAATGGALWISVGESARLFADGEAVGIVDKLRVESLHEGGVGALRQAQALAERQAGHERQAPILARFSATVTDRETGLQWAGRDSGGPISWADANAFCEGMVVGGADDWRLPNVGELEALLTAVKGGGMEEASNGARWYPVPGVRASYTRFWSSSATLIIDNFGGSLEPEKRALIAHIVDFGATEQPRIRVFNLETPSGSALCVRG